MTPAQLDHLRRIDAHLANDAQRGRHWHHCLVRLVIWRPFTRKAIGVFHPIGSHYRTSKVLNHKLGKMRAWTFTTRKP